MTETKHYWDDRRIQPPNRIGNAIKRSPVTQGLVDVLFSVRVSDEVFLSRMLSKHGVKSVLDVACGSGKAIIPSMADHTIGVDIGGFPSEIARSVGYNECIEYEPPHYEFDVGRAVDAVTVINLNAHVSMDAYRTIIKQATRHLRPGGTLILIHEYDNQGMSYRLMHRYPRKFERFVRGMEHWHLDYESSVMKSLESSLSGLKQVTRRPLVGDLLPAIHYYAYLAEKNPGPLLSQSFKLADVPLSIANYLLCRLGGGTDRCFLVGYVFKS